MSSHMMIILCIYTCLLNRHGLISVYLFRFFQACFLKISSLLESFLLFKFWLHKLIYVGLIVIFIQLELKVELLRQDTQTKIMFHHTSGIKCLYHSIATNFGFMFSHMAVILCIYTCLLNQLSLISVYNVISWLNAFLCNISWWLQYLVADRKVQSHPNNRRAYRRLSFAAFACLLAG